MPWIMQHQAIPYASLPIGAPGDRQLVSLNGSNYMMVRGPSFWEFLVPSAPDQAYVFANPIPEPEFNPFRSHIYLAPAAGMMSENTFEQRATTSIIKRVSKASFGWTTVRLHMADITGSPLTPEGIWFGLQDVDSDNPIWVNDLVAATGLVAPPAGTDDEPGIGPVCNFVTLPGTTTTKAIVVRIQMPGGTITQGSISTNDELVPSFVSRFNNAIAGSIAGNPGTSSGWGEAFGQIPWFSLEVAGLTVPQCLLGGIGDSHLQGYRADQGGQGTRGMLGEMADLQTTENLCVTNFARTGHTTDQIAARLRVFEEAFDLGGWLRQRASVNDRDGNSDYTLIQADASFDLLQADYAYLSGRNKLMIPLEGLGFNDGPSGWYGRFNTHRAAEQALWPGNMYNASSILNADGSYLLDMFGPDGGHPSLLGNQTWAVPSWASLQSALTSLGVTI